MNGWREAAGTVCVSLLVTAAVRYLAPNGLTQEMLRLVSGLLVLVTVAGALRSVGGAILQTEWTLPAADTALEETLYRQRMDAAEGALYDAVYGVLQAAGVEARVHIIFETGDNLPQGSIGLDRIRVTAEYAVQRERAAALLRELFPGVHIEVDGPDE